MTEPEPTSEDREKQLAERLKIMEQQLERLTSRLSEVDTEAETVHEARIAAKTAGKEHPPEDIGDVSEEVLNWASRNALLPRLATLCFLLVVALILRTITDSGLINKLVGSGIGMSYAAILMIVSWYNYRKQSPHAPIFAASGAILMSTIVVETHAHFNSLPLVPAYLTLMATGIGMALISRQFNAFTPISVGTLGMCFAGAAIDYPHPFFPYLSLVLFTANLLGYFAAQLKRCSWLRWSGLLVTMLMLQLWGVQIVAALRKGEAIPAELAISWFFPVMAVFTATYLTLALLGVVRSKNEKISLFDLVLPTLTAIWVFALMFYVARAPNGGSTFAVGFAGVFIAAGLLAISFRLAQRGVEGAPGASSFILACGVLLALALPAITRNLVLSLPIFSMVAIFMAVMSRVWSSGSIRLITYIFHLYSCIAMIVVFKIDGLAAMDAVNILPAGLLTIIILYQYQWCRWCPPAAEYAFFSFFDKHDRSAGLLLLAGLVSGFIMMRCVTYQMLLVIAGSVLPAVFQCVQSVLINSAAVVLIILAYLRSSKELRNVAILVSAVGGIKVFAYDLLGTHGLPLVLSVFSFGIAVAVESIALGRWQKRGATPKTGTSEE